MLQNYKYQTLKSASTVPVSQEQRQATQLPDVIIEQDESEQGISTAFLIGPRPKVP